VIAPVLTALHPVQKIALPQDRPRCMARVVAKTTEKLLELQEIMSRQVLAVEGTLERGCDSEMKRSMDRRGRVETQPTATSSVIKTSL
jgi:hypothetical protein